MNEYRNSIRELTKEANWTFWKLLPLAGMVIVVLIIFFFGIGLIHSGLSWLTTQPPSAEQIWLESQQKRCAAMNSRLELDPVAKIARCWRTPFMRTPKLMFEETLPPAPEPKS